MSRYIFGIGMNKTGTSSLYAALNRLGFRCLHRTKLVKRTRERNKKAGRKLLAGLDHKYDAFCDSPINWMFRDLDRDYPGSKFIVTVRDMQSWLPSRIAQFGKTAEYHRQHYDRHMANVAVHFADRPDDFMYYDLCGGEGWEPLCAFLGVPVPKSAFPHRNKTGSKRLRSARRRARK